MASIADLTRQCLADSEAYFPEVAHDFPYMVLALAGEVGELANIVKKIERGSLEHDQKVHLDMAMELVDVFIYLLNAAAILNIDLEAAYMQKREFNNNRFLADEKVQVIEVEVNDNGTD